MFCLFNANVDVCFSYVSRMIFLLLPGLLTEEKMQEPFSSFKRGLKVPGTFGQNGYLGSSSSFCHSPVQNYHVHSPLRSIVLPSC